MKNKEAVGNLGEEEMSFLKRVRMTRDDTRRDADDLFSAAHQTRERDIKLLEKLFEQAPLALHMRNNLLKQASEDQFMQYEKIKIAYNVHAFFDGGHHMSPAQRRFPELMKVAKARPVVSIKKPAPQASTTGATGSGSLMSGASV